MVPDLFFGARGVSTGPGGLCTPNLHPRESPADVMLSSDVCLVCVHSEQQTIDAVAGDEGLLTVGSSAMTDKVAFFLGEAGRERYIKVQLLTQCGS